MGKTRYDHYHTYEVVGKQRRLWRCTREGCTHTISTLLISGRSCECRICTDKVVITPDHLKYKIIVCTACAKDPKRLAKPTKVEDPMALLMAAVE